MMTKQMSKSVMIKNGNKTYSTAEMDTFNGRHDSIHSYKNCFHVFLTNKSETSSILYEVVVNSFRYQSRI